MAHAQPRSCGPSTQHSPWSSASTRFGSQVGSMGDNQRPARSVVPLEDQAARRPVTAVVAGSSAVGTARREAPKWSLPATEVRDLSQRRDCARDSCFPGDERRATDLRQRGTPVTLHQRLEHRHLGQWPIRCRLVRWHQRPGDDQPLTCRRRTPGGSSYISKGHLPPLHQSPTRPQRSR